MRYLIYLILCIYFVTFVVSQPAGENPCTHLVADDGSVYDLTVLIERGAHTIQGFDADINEHFDFSFAVCQNLPKGCGGEGDPVCASDGSAGSCMCFSPCQDWDQWCYGTFSYQPDVQPLDDGQGVLIEYNKVDSLGTRLHLLCDYSFAGMDKYNITKKDRTIYDIMILTDAACPISGGGLSGGTYFLIALLVVCILYLIVGILINKFSRMKNGREVVPNVTFWTTLPGLVVDGAKFSVHKITGRTPHTGYTTVK